MNSRRESRLRTFAAKLRGFLHAPQRDDRFEDEIQEHVRLLADRFVAQGMSREDAAVAARRQFGNTTLLQEDRRDMQTFPSVEVVCASAGTPLLSGLLYGVKAADRCCPVRCR